MNKKGEIMSEKSPQQPTTSLLEVVASFLFGGAVLTMALFPLAVPMVALLIVVALPLIALGAGVAFEALNHAGVADGFTYVSTAGGAFLEWMEGRELPGVKALESGTGQ